MPPAIENLTALFQSEGWTVDAEATTAPSLGFSMIAENQVAVAFVARVVANGLEERTNVLASAVAAVLQRLGGPKAWEGYLLLLVDGLSDVPTEVQGELQRDLIYCRRILLDAQSVELSDAPLEYLLKELAMLFPMSTSDLEGEIDVRALLLEELVRRGNDRSTTARLLEGFSDPKFDALALMSRTEHAE